MGLKNYALPPAPKVAIKQSFVEVSDIGSKTLKNNEVQPKTINVDLMGVKTNEQPSKNRI